ncbi:MAG: hypothetical protein IJ418_12100 [Clostridia bacterium]|nr:hypothetical protein [Clostridia bacterium]
MDIGRILHGILFFAPFSVFILPEGQESLGLIILLVCAILYCFCLKEKTTYSLELAILPAFVCVLSGIGALRNFEQITLSAAADSFCHFIVGVWFFVVWNRIKTTEKK